MSIVPSSERRLCGVVDIDGDGKSESVTCFGNQTYLKRDDQSLVPVAQGQFAAAGDMNGDGKKDLILKEDQGLVIYENLSQ